MHYNGASLLQWRSVRLDCAVGAGDIAGIGWERTTDPPVQGETPKGKVYFTYNGRRLQPWIDDVAGALFPVVHIQKKVKKTCNIISIYSNTNLCMLKSCNPDQTVLQHRKFIAFE